MEATKYAENNIIYVNFGNTQQSQKISEQKRSEELEAIHQLRERKIEGIGALQMEICDKINVISAMVQTMEKENRCIKGEMPEKGENTLSCRTRSICENSRKILDLMQEIMRLQERGQAFLNREKVPR